MVYRNFLLHCFFFYILSLPLDFRVLHNGPACTQGFHCGRSWDWRTQDTVAASAIWRATKEQPHLQPKIHAPHLQPKIHAPHLQPKIHAPHLQPKSLLISKNSTQKASSSPTIEEGWREKQRQRSSRLFVGQNCFNSLPR